MAPGWEQRQSAWTVQNLKHVKRASLIGTDLLRGGVKVSVLVMLCCDWWRPTCALRLRGCYFTIGGGAFKVHVSENEASQKDVCLADVNLKLHCSLQEEQRGGRWRKPEEKGEMGVEEVGEGE